MNIFEQKALDFVQRFHQRYFESAEPQQLLADVEDRIVWIGPGRQDICYQIGELEQLLLKEQQLQRQITIKKSTYHTTELAADICLVQGSLVLYVTCQPQDLPHVRMRFSAICRQTETGPKLTHMHLSLPEGEQTEAGVFSVFLPNDSDKLMRKVINDQSIRLADLIFEWDIQQDTLYVSSGWEGKFRIPPMLRSLKESVSQLHIHPEDLPGLMQQMQNMRMGLAYFESELRVADQNGDYVWCQLRATLHRLNNLPSKVLGVLVDINDEKQASLRLREKAERDSLTGLYNKEMFQIRIQDYLRERELGTMSAFLIIDVDNFKQINDIYGHLSGDAVLSDIASALKQQFRPRDVIGRIGGDEFAVFMHDVKGQGAVEKKAQRILDVFQGLLSEHRERFPLSCSIGIALYPQDGRVFNDLYKDADLALYSVKKAGKASYRFYHPEMRSVSLSDEFSAVNEVIDSEHAPAGERQKPSWSENGFGIFENSLVERIFSLMSNVEDVEGAIPGVLELIGKKYDISRVYLFENEGDQKFSNTYEWCNVGIAPQKEAMQQIPVADYYSLFDYDNIFYCRDVNQLNPELGPLRELLQKLQVKSALQCAIKQDGQICGFVGFDECKNNRFWTQEQIDMLKFISQLLSVFLFRKRALQESDQTLSSLKSILDHQDELLYVLDPETYTVLYANKSATALFPNLQIGGTCYQAFFNLEEVCEKCPTRYLDQPGAEDAYIWQSYSPVLQKTIRTRATKITWAKGKTAYLLSWRLVEDAVGLRGEKQGNTE